MNKEKKINSVNKSEFKTRKEEDLLGEKQVPIDALYGIRTLRAIECLSFSNKKFNNFPYYVKSLAQVKKAAALTNKNAEIIPSDISQAIQDVCDEIINQNYLDHFIADTLSGGGSIALNMNMNEVIANLANLKFDQPLGSYTPCDPKKHVNASQSTADACHTALRMAIAERGERLLDCMDDFIVIADAKSLEFANVDIIARTCMQDAMIVKLGGIFKAHSEFSKRSLERLSSTIRELHYINLGGTVVGDNSGAAPRYLAEILINLRRISGRKVKWRDDLKDAAQNIDDILNYSNVLSIISSGLIKIAKDLRLLSSSAFQDIVLPAVQEGSSFFKGKINPVVPETLIQACCQVEGNIETVRKVLQHGELDLNVFEGAGGFNALEATDFLIISLAQFTKWCYRGINPNRDFSKEKLNLMENLRKKQ